MTKIVRAGVALAAAFALVALASLTVVAHGAPEPREIDQRVITDYTGPGGLGEYDQVGSGLDLLTLDVREAYDPFTGQPAVVFRMVWQGGDEAAEHLVTLEATTDQARSFDVAVKAGQILSHSFDMVSGPFDVGDGHPKAVDGWVLYSRMSIGPGSKMTDIKLESRFGETAGDVMPGTFYVEGTLAPSDPTYEPGVAEYTLEGPADLLGLVASSSQPSIPLSLEPTTLNFTLANKVGALDQFVTLRVQAPAAVNATLSSVGVKLAGGETGRNVTLTLAAPPGATAGPVLVTAITDLGGFANYSVQVVPPQVAPAPADNTTQPPTPDGDGSVPSTGAMAALAVLGAAAVAVARRRRT